MVGTITIHLHCMITPRPSLAEGVEDLNLLLVRVIIRTRCLQNHGNVVQSGVIHYTLESLRSNVTFTNILMSVQVVPNFSFKPNIIPVLINATLLLTLVYGREIHLSIVIICKYFQFILIPLISLRENQTKLISIIQEYSISYINISQFHCPLNSYS